MSIIKVVKARNSKYDPPAGGRNSERGDTIVEVMFAMAIIGVVLAAAYGIASKNLQTSQLAKERTQATQIAESQLEQLKALRDDPADGNFCLDIESASYITTIADVNNITEPECISGFFSKSITKNVDGNNPDEYLIVVEWVPPGGREDNKSKVELKYKDYDYDLSGTQNLAVFIVSYSGNSAVLGVRIINESSSSNRGIVYGTVNDPTIGAVGTIGTIPNVANEDSFNSTLVGLNPSTTYYARVYVETAPGVYKYGRSIRISNSATTPVTAPPPVVLGGSAYSSCVGSGGFSCNNVGSSVTSCANFRVDYDVTPPSGAGYNAVVIDYGDYYCGGPVQAPPRDWYNFNVDVYINGVRNVVDAQLDAQGGSAVVPLVGNFASISSIGVDWTNN
jgi:prepilin-type N-terminal cleavage/methylation domain-containing protein